MHSLGQKISTPTEEPVSSSSRYSAYRPNPGMRGKRSIHHQAVIREHPRKPLGPMLLQKLYSPTDAEPNLTNISQAEMLRQDVDIGLARFLSQEMTEDSKRGELTALLEEVDILEAEVNTKYNKTQCSRCPVKSLLPSASQKRCCASGFTLRGLPSICEWLVSC